MATSGGVLGFFGFIDETGSTSSFDIASTSVINTMYKDYDFPKAEAQTSCKISIEFSTNSTVFGVRQIIVTYDPAE
jgi:hypothetical protein